eukprot:2474295-Amphidinium_carterae.2
MAPKTLQFDANNNLVLKSITVPTSPKTPQQLYQTNAAYKSDLPQEDYIQSTNEQCVQGSNCPSIPNSNW